jgi:hypothetical protein
VGTPGERKLLLVNKRNKDVELTLPQPAKKVQFVDQTTKNNPPGTRFSRLKLARTRMAGETASLTDEHPANVETPALAPPAAFMINKVNLCLVMWKP